MKVILAAKSVYPYHPIGGLQKYVYYFAQFLSQEGVNVEIVAPLDKGRPRTEVHAGLTYTFLWPSIFRYLEYPIGWLGVHLFSFAVSQYLKNKEFDILHSFDMAGYQYLKRYHRKPVIFQIFSDNYLSNPISTQHLLGWLNVFGYKTENIKKKKVRISPFADLGTVLRYPAQYFLKVKPVYRCCKDADMVFFEEEIFRNEVVTLFRLNAEEKRYQVIPVGIDTHTIQQRLKDTRLTRKDLGLDDKDTVLITVNRLAADKGVDKLVLTIKEIIGEYPHVKLIIIGMGYLEKEISNLIDKYNLNKHVLRFRNIPEEKLYHFYSLSDIYICAFSYPGSSVSTLEAMACGLSVITTAQPWLVEEGNGRFVDDNDPLLLKEATLDLIKNHQLKTMGEISRKIAQRYDWLEIAKASIQKYQILIENSKNG